MNPALHLLMPISLSLYCFLFKKNKFDLIYIIFVFCIFLHWTFFNGECIISYYYKKNMDESYIAGKDCLTNDFHIEYKNYSTCLYLCSFILNFLIMYNVYIILKRNHYTLLWSLSFIILHEIYYYGSFLFKNHYKNKTYLFFQECIKYLLLLWGFLFIVYA